MKEQNRSELAKIVLVIVLFAGVMIAGAVTIGMHSNSNTFFKVIGVYPAKGAKQAAQMPIITVNIGQIRKNAVASWNEYQGLIQQVDAMTITSDSSADDASKKVNLINQAEDARIQHQRDWNHFRFACRLLKNYPAEARSVCPVKP